MISVEELCIRARVEQRWVEAWITAGWLIPPRTDPQPMFSDLDLARAQRDHLGALRERVDQGAAAGDDGDARGVPRGALLIATDDDERLVGLRDLVPGPQHHHEDDDEDDDGDDDDAADHERASRDECIHK